MRSAIAEIGEIARTKQPSRNNAEAMAQRVAKVRKNLHASIPILLPVIADHDRETTSRLLLGRLAKAIALENNIEIESKELFPVISVNRSPKV